MVFYKSPYTFLSFGPTGFKYWFMGGGGAPPSLRMFLLQGQGRKTTCLRGHSKQHIIAILDMGAGLVYDNVSY